jgi:hypothetical protein
MNMVESIDKLVLAINSGRMGVALKIFAGIARWTWRGCSVVNFLFSVPLLLIGLPYGIKVMLTSPDWTIGDVLMFVFIGLFVGGLALAWRWEGLGALLNCIVLGIPTVIGLIQGQHDNELGGYVAWALALLVVLSWSLNTLKDSNAKPRSRRLAMILAPLLVIAIGFCVSCMPGAKFNP